MYDISEKKRDRDDGETLVKRYFVVVCKLLQEIPHPQYPPRPLCFSLFYIRDWNSQKVLPLFLMTDHLHKYGETVMSLSK